MLQVREAQEKMVALVPPMATETLHLTEAVGRIIAGAHHAKRNCPPWDNSAMDGFAVRMDDIASASSESPIRLKLVGEIACGDIGATDSQLPSGCAVRIMTGAMVPPGADAVVIKEKTRLESQGKDDFVEFEAPTKHHANIRFAGEDVAQGDVVGGDGHCVTPARLSLMASAGFFEVEVYQKPKIALIASGSELVPLGAAPQPHQIINSNIHAVAAALESAGASVRHLGIATDTLEAHVELMASAAPDEWVVTIGGVSMGEKDWVRPALAKMGAEQIFWKVAMRPGKPLVFARKAGQLFVGLPGNPVSALVGAELFLKPMIRRSQNRHKIFKSPLWAVLSNDEPIKKRADFMTYFRAKVDFGSQPPKALALTKQSSGQISGLAAANALLVTPVGIDSIAPGARVQVLPFS